MTLIPTRPARIRTTPQTRRTKPHLHHHTPADTFPRSHAPSALPYSQPYHRTTAPYSQSHHRTTVPPRLSPALQTHHRKYNIPHRHTAQPCRTTAPHHRTVLSTVLSTVLPTAPPHHRTAPPDTPSHHPDHIHITSFPHHATTRSRHPQAGSTPSRRSIDATSTPHQRSTDAAPPPATGARVAAGPRRRRRRR